MARNPQSRKVECWLVMKGIGSAYAHYSPGSPYSGQPVIENIRVVRVTAKRPTLNADEIVFKMEVDVDESWFLDGAATIKAALPAPSAATSEIQATVDLPIRARSKSAAASVLNP